MMILYVDTQLYAVATIVMACTYMHGDGFLRLVLGLLAMNIHEGLHTLSCTA